MGLTALGGPALALAAGAACASAVASWDGQRRSRPASVAWGRRGLAAVFGLLSVAVVALGWALVGQDYALVYVADNVSRDTSWPYRLAGMWGGMSGSLLLWTWMLAGWALVASRSVRRRLPELAGGVQAVLALEAAVFLGLLVTASRPFATLAVPAIEGAGLTPILRHPAMLYHPPLLYCGYVGLGVPAALAVAALAADSGREWVAVARRFMVPSLFLLAAGMAAGAHWAYVELGWGGYWAWDPVENGALLPWLAGVAFLHSAVVVADRRDAERAASGPHGLAFVAFGLSLLGAFLTRSGVTASVHAFAEARLVGRVLLAALAAASAAMVGLMIVFRRRGGAVRVGALTRAGAVRANNALLLAVIAVVGFGLLYPVVAGDGVVVTGRYFAVVTAPLAVGVLAAIGIGPRLGRRARPWSDVRRRVRPAWWGTAALVAAVVALDDRRPLPLALIGLAGSAAALTIAEWRSRARRPAAASASATASATADMPMTIAAARGRDDPGPVEGGGGRSTATAGDRGAGGAVEGGGGRSTAGDRGDGGAGRGDPGPVEGGAGRSTAAEVAASATVVVAGGIDRTGVAGGAVAGGDVGDERAPAVRSARSGRGGLVAHLGVAVLLAGVAGTATGTHRSTSLVPGQSVSVRGVTFRLDEVAPLPAPDGGRAARATLILRRGGRHLATLRPVALVAASGDRVSETALRSTPFEDVQVALRTVSGGGGAVVVEIFVAPLAQWVWWGAMLVALGVGLSMGGNRARTPRRQSPNPLFPTYRCLSAGAPRPSTSSAGRGIASGASGREAP